MEEAAQDVVANEKDSKTKFKRLRSLTEDLSFISKLEFHILTLAARNCNSEEDGLLIRLTERDRKLIKLLVVLRVIIFLSLLPLVFGMIILLFFR